MNQTKTHIPLPFLALTIYSLLVLVFIFNAGLLIFSHVYNIDLDTIREAIIFSLFRPNMNECLVYNIEGINVMALISGLFIFSILTGVFFWRWVKYKQIHRLPLSYCVTAISLVGLTAFSFSQDFMRYNYSSFVLKKFSNRSEYAQKKEAFKAPFLFAYAVQQRLPAYHRAKVLSDVQIHLDPYSTIFNTTSYFLYPKLSLRYNNGKPMDCLFLFFKNDPLKFIPQDYTILVATEDKTMILAIKNDQLP